MFGDQAIHIFAAVDGGQEVRNGAHFVFRQVDARHVGLGAVLERALHECRDQVLVGCAVELVRDVAQWRPGLQGMAVRARHLGQQATDFEAVAIIDDTQAIWHEGMQLEKAAFGDLVHLTDDALARHVTRNDLVAVDVLPRHIRLAHRLAHPLFRPHTHDGNECEQRHSQRGIDAVRFPPCKHKPQSGHGKNRNHALRIHRQQMRIEHHDGIVWQRLQVIQKHHHRKQPATQTNGRKELDDASAQLQVLHSAGNHQAHDHRHHQHRACACTQVSKEVDVVKSIIG